MMAIPNIGLGIGAYPAREMQQLGSSISFVIISKNSTLRIAPAADLVLCGEFEVN